MERVPGIELHALVVGVAVEGADAPLIVEHERGPARMQQDGASVLTVIVLRGRPLHMEARGQAGERAVHAVLRRDLVPVDQGTAVETQTRTDAQPDDGLQGEGEEEVIVAVVVEIVSVEDVDKRVVSRDAGQLAAHFVGLTAAVHVVAACRLEADGTVVGRKNGDVERKPPVHLLLLEIVAYTGSKVQPALPRQAEVEHEARL